MSSSAWLSPDRLPLVPMPELRRIVLDMHDSRSNDSRVSPEQDRKLATGKEVNIKARFRPSRYWTVKPPSASPSTTR